VSFWRAKNVNTIPIILGDSDGDDDNFFFFFFFFLRNCTIDPCDLAKLKIVHSGIKINLEILVVKLVYKLLPEVKFR
jgi:hypothetical protein